jgi:transcriptional regulator with XRE-family HTH domain
MADTPRFGTFLKEAREKAGLTQAALALKCRLTGSYISLLESGKKPAPSDRVVRKLAAALSLPPEAALEVAHVDRAPEDLRLTIESLRRQAALEQEMRERTAEALFPLSTWSLGPVLPAGRARRGVPPTLGAEVVHALDRLMEMARHATDFGQVRDESRRVLASLPPEERRRVLAAVPALIESAGKGSGLRLVPAPEPGLPPDIRPGDTLVLDPHLEPAPGDTVLAGEPGKPAVLRWEKGGGAVAGVVIEVRKRLK